MTSGRAGRIHWLVAAIWMIGLFTLQFIAQRVLAADKLWKLPNSGVFTLASNWFGGVRDLWDLLLSHGVDPAADGWSALSAAGDISADGSTIVGYGRRNYYNNEAFIAVIPTIVPEPSSLALLTLVVPALFRRRHSCRRPVLNPY
jgi:hypothetical protein